MHAPAQTLIRGGRGDQGYLSKAADKKRWAILPPPSPTSAKISGEFTIERRLPARRTVSGHYGDRAHEGDAAQVSSVRELEPSDSERETEVPPSGDMPQSHVTLKESDLETIPAPPVRDDED